MQASDAEQDQQDPQESDNDRVGTSPGAVTTHTVASGSAATGSVTSTSPRLRAHKQSNQQHNISDKSDNIAIGLNLNTNSNTIHSKGRVNNNTNINAIYDKQVQVIVEVKLVQVIMH